MRAGHGKGFRRALAGALAAALLATPGLRAAEAGLETPSPVTVPAAEAPDGGGLSLGRIALGFAVTSGMKYLLGGIGAAKLLPLMAGLNPAVAAPALLAYSMVEAVASIAVFNQIAGIEKRDKQVLAFVLASAASAFATPFLMGLGPLGATLVSNAARLVLFNLIARPLDQRFSIGGLPTIAALRASLGGGDEEIPAVSSVEELAPDHLWAGTPAGERGDLLELHRRVRERYEDLLEQRGYSDAALRRYASAKKSLDAAIARLTNP